MVSPATVPSRSKVAVVSAALLAIVLVAVISQPSGAEEPADRASTSVSAATTEVLTDLPPASNSEARLQPNTIRVLRLIERLWPHYRTPGTIGGWREDPIADHPSGQALDIMVPGGADDADGIELTNEIAAFLMVNAEVLGVTYMVWRQHIWYPGRAWRLMGDRGNPTDNHMDHIHLLVRGQHVPSGGLVLPSAIPPGTQPPDIEAIWRAHRAHVRELRQAVTHERTLLKQARAATERSERAVDARTADVEAALQEVRNVIRRSYMFGQSMDLASSTVGLLTDPAAVGVADLVIEREDLLRDQALADAVAAVDTASNRRDSRRAALALQREQLDAAVKQLQRATDPWRSLED